MRRATAILGLISCGFAVASIYLWRELGHERLRNAELLARLTSAPASASRAATQPTSQGPVMASPTPLAAPAATTAQSTTLRQSTVSQDDADAYRRRMMRDPKYRELQHEQYRLALAPRRANLIRLLGITPAVADAVIDLQIDREFEQAEELANPATEESRQQQQQRAEVHEKEYQAKLLEMLSSDQNARLQHYMESRQTRMQVDTFRTQLNGADVLRDDQVEPLIEALHGERSRMYEELEQYRETLNADGLTADSSQRYNERQADLMKKMHAGMHSSAAAILSSSQLEQLDGMLARELQRLEAQMRMSRLQSKLENTGAAATQPD